MKVLITTACWGSEYIAVLSNFSIASLLSPGNLETVCKQHQVTWQVIAPAADLTALRAAPSWPRLSELCTIDEVSFESLGHDPARIPRDSDGAKYSFLSVLQNHAIRSSLGCDVIVFNYSDFIWSDGSLDRCLRQMAGGSLDAIFTFCLPVDKVPGERDLEDFRDRSDSSQRIVISPRAAARIAIDDMHRETKLRLWGGEKASAAPSYVIWRAGAEGLVVRASHQTILCLRVKPNDRDYVDGIREGSLDGYFSAIVAERWNHTVAGDSDQIFVFSLYDTIWDSTLGPEMTAEDMLRLHLMRSAPSQNRLVDYPILIKRHYVRPQVWEQAISESAEVMKRVRQPGAPASMAIPPAVPPPTMSDAPAGDDAPSAAQIIVPDRAPAAMPIVPALKRAAFLGLLAVANSSPGAAVRKIIGPTGRRLGRMAVFRVAGIKMSSPRDGAAESAAAVVPNRAAPARRGEAPADNTSMHSAEQWVALFSAGKLEEILRCFGGRDRQHVVLLGFSVPGEAAARLRAVQWAEGLLGNISQPAVVDRVLDTRDVLLAQAMAIAPDWPDLAEWRAINRFLSGKHEEALEEFSRTLTLREHMAAAVGLDPAKAVYLPRSCAYSIGLMSHIDAYIKRKLLVGDDRPMILLTAPGSVVNPTYLEYWQDHIEIVTDPETVAACEDEEPAYSHNWNWVLPSDGTTKRPVDYIHRRIAAVQRQWQAEGHPPLLTLKNAHRAALDAQKRQWGMKDDDWFVCLHVRSAGFKNEAAGGANDFRNTPIEDYYPAIRLIAEMGGWVIRMGDSSMPPLALDRLPARVIDYALRPEKSSLLDVALCASCRLFVSAPSGLSVVARSFGRPCALVNYPIQIGLPWFPGDVFIFKRIYSNAEKRHLSLQEIFSSEIPYAITQHLLDREEVTLHANDPHEIAEVVREALLRDRYAVDCPEIARDVQARFADVNRRYSCGISARIGTQFAISHAAELLGERITANARLG